MAQAQGSHYGRCHALFIAESQFPEPVRPFGSFRANLDETRHRRPVHCCIMTSFLRPFQVAVYDATAQKYRSL